MTEATPKYDGPIAETLREFDALAKRQEKLVEALGRLMVVGSAATGHLMCDFNTLHGYVEEIMKRPVWTHEMGTESVAAEIKERAKQPFVEAIEQARAALLAAQEGHGMTTAAEATTRLVRCDGCRLLHPEDAACPEPCGQCGGSGEAPDVSPAGVVNRRYLVDCGACDGTGAERGARP